MHGADGVPMIDYGDSKPYTINDIKIFGVKYLDPDILTASSGLMRGETVYIPATPSPRRYRAFGTSVIFPT